MQAPVFLFFRCLLSPALVPGQDELGGGVGERAAGVCIIDPQDILYLFLLFYFILFFILTQGHTLLIDFRERGRKGRETSV